MTSSNYDYFVTKLNTSSPLNTTTFLETCPFIGSEAFNKSVNAILNLESWKMMTLCCRLFGLKGNMPMCLVADINTSNQLSARYRPHTSTADIMST